LSGQPIENTGTTLTDCTNSVNIVPTRHAVGQCSSQKAPYRRHNAQAAAIIPVLVVAQSYRDKPQTVVTPQQVPVSEQTGNAVTQRTYHHQKEKEGQRIRHTNKYAR
jgi:hypothetical protein